MALEFIMFSTLSGCPVLMALALLAQVSKADGLTVLSLF